MTFSWCRPGESTSRTRFLRDDGYVIAIEWSKGSSRILGDPRCRRYSSAYTPNPHFAGVLVGEEPGSGVLVTAIAGDA